MASKYQINKAVDGKFYFHLLADNGQISWQAKCTMLKVAP